MSRVFHISCDKNGGGHGQVLTALVGVCNTLKIKNPYLPTHRPYQLEVFIHSAILKICV